MNKRSYVLAVNCSLDENDLTIREFVRPVQRLLPFPSRVIHISKLKKSFVKSPLAVIFSGCPMADNSYQKLIPKMLWLKEINTPLLGICAGQHLLGTVFGGKIQRMKKPVIGIQKMKKKKEHSLLKDFPKTFSVYGMHQFELIPGRQFQSLVSNDIIIHKKKKIAGVSFHPEVKNHSLFANFFDWIRE
jgi:GMP synthase (glutamine-hydrolysing)